MGRLKNHMMEKRYRWDVAHMKAAEAYASLSFDPDRKVGCVIACDDSVVACGWNGTPPGEPNDCKGEDGKTLPTVIHAEMNAIQNAFDPIEGCTVYITLSPCHDCALELINNDVKRVVYKDLHKCRQGLDMLEVWGIETEQVNDRC